MSLAEERAGKPFQRPYWLLFSVNLLLSLTLYLSNPLMNLRLNRAGIEAGTAGAVIGSMSLASLLFRPFSGWVCDRFRRKSLLLIFTLLTAVSLGGYGAVNHAALPWRVFPIKYRRERKARAWGFSPSASRSLRRWDPRRA